MTKLYLWNTMANAEVLTAIRPNFIVEEWADIVSTIPLHIYIQGLRNFPGTAVILKAYDGLKYDKMLESALIHFKENYPSFGGVFVSGASNLFEKFYGISDIVPVYTDILGMLRAPNRQKINVFVIKPLDTLGYKALKPVIGKPKEVIKHFTVCSCGKATIDEVIKWHRKNPDKPISLGYFFHKGCKKFTSSLEIVKTLEKLKTNL